MQQKKNNKICLFFDRVTFLEQVIFLHILERSNFLRRCEYMYREKLHQKILEFLKHFSSRSHHKLFFEPPCMLCILKLKVL